MLIFFNSDMANHQQKFHFVLNVYAEFKRVILLLKAILGFKYIIFSVKIKNRERDHEISTQKSFLQEE